MAKRKGAIIKVSLAEDARAVQIDKTFLICLGDEPRARNFLTRCREATEIILANGSKAPKLKRQKQIV